MYAGPYIENQINVSPQLVLTSEILQLPAAVLEQRILHELEENPALERMDSSYCPQCGAPVMEGQRMCYRCARQTGDEDDASDPQFRLEAWIPERITLERHLWSQLRLSLPSSLHSLAEQVVGDLDEHGFLPLSDQELAQRHGASVAAIARITMALREVDPVGIGARDAREALLIQIAHLSQGTNSPQLILAQAVLEEHWDLLRKGERSWGEIARAQDVSVGAVREAVALIVRDLNPFPAQAWKGETKDSPDSMDAPVWPDVLLHALPSPSETQFEVELLEQYRFRLRINELYAELVRGEVPGVDESDIDTARYYLEGARLFLNSLDQRRRTLQQVALALAEYQRDFVLHGPRHLRPLTRAQIADQLGVHESTISRAVAHKHVQMPSRQIIPLADFFDNSLPAKHDLQSLIIQEDKAHPSSDQVLAAQLRSLGHDITRRTVTKYRRALGIPSSHLRHLAAEYRGLTYPCPSNGSSGRTSLEAKGAVS